MIPISNITLTTLSAYNLHLDRTTRDIINLPYDKHDLHVKPNTQITTSTINNIIRKFDKNLHYIISNTYFANTSILRSNPDVLKLDINNNTVTFKKSIHQPVEPIQSIIISNDVEPTAGTVIATKEKIVLATFNNRRVGVTNTYCSDIPYNNIYDSGRYKHIKSISYSNNMLYVLDSGGGESPPVLYQYNISSVVKNEATLRRHFINQIGGRVTRASFTDGLRNPKFVYASDESVYVVDFDDNPDSGGFIKEYDKSLNFKNIYDITYNFSAYSPVSMFYKNNKMYILCNYAKENNAGYILVYDLAKKTVTEKIKLPGIESCVHISTSTGSDNTIYIATEKFIYKSFITKLDKPIGRIKFTSLGIGTTCRDIHITKSNTVNDDEIIICGETGICTIDNEDLDYKSIVYNDTDQKLINYDSQKIKPDEFVNHFTINKILYKQLYNHLIWRENIRNTFEISENSLTTKYINTFSDNIINLFNYTENINNFVGINEYITTSVINRCLDRIIELQELLVECIKSKRKIEPNILKVDE